MGQRCSRENRGSMREDSDMCSEDDEHDNSNSQSPKVTGPQIAGPVLNTFTGESSSSTLIPNEFRRKDSLRNGSTNQQRTHGRRASNYNDIHIQVSETLMQYEEKNQQLALKDYRPMGVVGLANLGNSCYINCSLQCLSATIPLTDYFLGYDYKAEINKTNFLGTGGKLATAYAQLLKEMWLGNKAVVKPMQFKKQLSKFAPQFSGTYQQDAQEVLSFLLDGLHEDLNRVKDKPYIEDKDCNGTNDEADAIEVWKNYLRRNKSLIVDLFQGQLRNTCQCNVCGHRNIRFEPFMYLSLPISDSCRTLQDCLDLYISTDELSGDNRWYCEKCKKHRDGTKKTDLWILPPILIVHLKRFKYNDFGQVGSKNNANIEFPLEGWDLSDHVKSKGAVTPVYDLYAVSNHIGSLRSGHYTAFSLTRFDEQWVEFNDSSPRPVTQNAVRQKSAAAYVLFYNRSDKAQPADLQETPVASTRYPMVRRQSVTRPDLWPHTQVENNRFRDYTRRSTNDRNSVRSDNSTSFRTLSPPNSPSPAIQRNVVDISKKDALMPELPPVSPSLRVGKSATPAREQQPLTRKRSKRAGKFGFRK